MFLRLEKVKKALESKWLVLPLFAFALIFQALKLYSVNVLVCAILLSLILFICDDVKNIFAIIFYVSFFIGNIYLSPNWVVYGIAIGFVCVSFAFFTATKIVKKRKNGEKFKTSRLFYPLCVVSVIYCLGGIFSNFALLPFLATLGFSLVVLFFIFIATNYTKNLKDYLLFVFTAGGVLVSLVMFISNAIARKTIKRIFVLYQTWIASQNVNVAALFILIGLIACFSLGFKKKYGFVWLILASFLAFAIFTTSCRMVIALTVVFYLGLCVYSFIKTQYKVSYIICFSILFALFLAFIFSDLSFIKEGIYSIVHKSEGAGFFSGRIDIWAWCLDFYKKHPLLGYGFTAPVEANFPLTSSNIILAHNTFIQWLVSLGTLGTLVMVAFAFIKCVILLTSIKNCGVFIPLIVLTVALSGITDQAAQMDIFVYSLSLIAIVSIDDCSSLRKTFPINKLLKTRSLEKNNDTI